MPDNEKEKYSAREEKARKIVRNKLGFFKHGATYLIVIGFLYIVNNRTSSGYQWWVWAALGWGIGLVSHFVRVFIFSGGSLEEKMVQRELDRMDD